MVEPPYKIHPKTTEKTRDQSLDGPWIIQLIVWNNPDGTEELFTWILEYEKCGYQ